MGGGRQRGQRLRGVTGYDGQVVQGERRPVGFQQGQGLRVPLDGKDLPPVGQPGQLHGHRAGARAHVPAHCRPGQAEFGQTHRPDFGLGHGDPAPAERLVGQAGGDHPVRAGIFQQGHAQRIVSPLGQGGRGAGGQPFVGGGEPFPDVHGDLPQPRPDQGGAEILDAPWSAHQDKDPGMGAHVGHDVVVPAVEAHGIDVLIAGAQPGAQAGQRADPRQDPDGAERQQGQQLPGPAEKAHVPGQQDHKAAGRPAAGDVAGDGLGVDGGHGLLARPGHGVQHPLSAQETVGFCRCPEQLVRHGPPSAGADPGHGDLGAEGEGELLGQPVQHFAQRASFPLGRPAQDHQRGPGLPGGGGFFGKPAGGTAVLGHQIPRAGVPEQGQVQGLGKGSLHGQDVGRRQAGLLAGGQGVRHRQHPGIDPAGEVRQLGEGGQVLAAGGQQDGPLGPPQVVCCGLGVGHEHGLLRPRAGVPEQAQTGGVRGGAGGGNGLAGPDGIGVGGVHHQREALCPEQGFQGRLVQAAGRDGEVIRLGQQLLAVVRGHAGGDGQRLAGEKFQQGPPLGGPGKDAEFIHPGTPWA